MAVALGVGYLAGSLSLLQRVGAGLAAQAGEGTERADLVVEGPIADDNALQQLRRLVPDSLVTMIETVPGVASAEPRLEYSSALILGPNGTPVVNLGLTERPLGANFPEDPLLNPYRFVGAGAAPTAADEVVIDATSARAARVKVGDAVTIAAKSARREFTVTGVVTLADGDLPAGSSLALFTTPTARELFESGQDDNAIAIRLAPGTDPDTVRLNLAAITGGIGEVVDGDTYTAHRQVTFEKSFTLIRALLIGFAVLAVVVGSFTVSNSMALLFDHRRRTFALFRLVGASRRQLIGAALTEAAIAGLAAGAAGSVLGLAIGRGIEEVIQRLGTPLPVAGPIFTWWIPLVAIAVGVGVTVSTAAQPARAAAATPPVHAVATIEPGAAPLPRRVLRLLRRIAGLAALCAAGGFVFGGAPVAAPAAAVGAALGLIAVALPRLLVHLVGTATGWLAGSSRAIRRLATRRSPQSARRTAATTAALLAATAVISALSVLATSFNASITDEVTDAIRADLIIDSATFTKGGLTEGIVPALEQVDGVTAVTGWRTGSAVVGLNQLRIAGVNGATVFQLLDLDTTEAPPKRLGTDGVALSEQGAEAAGVGVGDTVQVAFLSGQSMTMTVRAVYRTGLQPVLGDAIIDASLVKANLPQSIDVMAFVKVSDPSDPAIRARIESVTRSYGSPRVLLPGELVSSRAELLRGFGRVIQWMLAFTVLLALIGVANTLQLGVNERRREFGLLRSVGASRRQVLRLVGAEAAALALVGSVIGIAVGSAGAYGTVAALRRFGLNQFVVPIPSVLGLGIAALAFGIIGAILPAARAARSSILDAVGEHEGSQRAKNGGGAPRLHSDLTGSETRSPRGPGESGSPLGSAHPTPPTHDEMDMATRCHACGAETGSGSRCQACGRPKVHPMFAIADEPPSATATAMASPVSPTPEDAPSAVPAAKRRATMFGRGRREGHSGASSNGSTDRHQMFAPDDSDPPPTRWETVTSADPTDAATNPTFVSAFMLLDAETRSVASGAAKVAAALLDPVERVERIVMGETSGAPTMLVETDVRLLVVTDRRPVPDIESFDASSGLHISGDTEADPASLTVTDHRRTITVDRIRDRVGAVAMAHGLTPGEQPGPDEQR